MARTAKLSDAQLVLLSSAAGRESGSLLPPPESLGSYSDRLRKVVAGLIKKQLAQETEDAGNDAAWRTDGDLRFGAVITETGRAAIGVAGQPPRDEASQPPPAPPLQTTKRATIIGLLQREQGATLDELTAATGWLPHTTRAALTGLRKKGHKIDREKRGDTTCYRIVSAG